MEKTIHVGQQRTWAELDFEASERGEIFAISPREMGHARSAEILRESYLKWRIRRAVSEASEALRGLCTAQAKARFAAYMIAAGESPARAEIQTKRAFRTRYLG